MPDDLKPVTLTAIDTNTQGWVPFPIPQLGVELAAMPSSTTLTPECRS